MTNTQINATSKAVFDFLTNFENVRDKVRLFIKNDKAIKDNEYTIPYLADMWYSFYIPANELDDETNKALKETYNMSDDAVMSFGVTKAIVDAWKVDSNELFNIALSNTLRETKANYMDLSDFMALFSSRPEKDNISEIKRNQSQQIIVKNQDGYRGAVVMLDKRVLEDISDFFNGDFYILPSSIHEVIVTDTSGDIEDLVRIVKEVNDTQVDLKDKLSDHVYRYNAKTHMIEFGA